MTKQNFIATAAAQTRVTNLVIKKAKEAISIFTDAPTIEIDETLTSDAYKVIVVKNEKSHMLTFAEIDVIREAIDKIIKRHKGCFYTMETRPYLSKSGGFLYMPVMEIYIRRYEFDYNELKFK